MVGLGARPVIVVGYDGSQASRAALGIAARHAGSSGVVFVVYAYDVPSDLLGSANSPRLLADQESHGRALLDEVLVSNDGPLREVTYETALLNGPAAPAIAGFARARNADEIIVGAQGFGRGPALGRVPYQLLHIADRPVLVMPPFARQSAQPIA